MNTIVYLVHRLDLRINGLNQSLLDIGLFILLVFLPSQKTFVLLNRRISSSRMISGLIASPSRLEYFIKPVPQVDSHQKMHELNDQVGDTSTKV